MFCHTAFGLAAGSFFSSRGTSGWRIIGRISGTSVARNRFACLLESPQNPPTFL